MMLKSFRTLIIACRCSCITLEIPAQVMIVGEAPGSEEERQGEPFVGASGHGAPTVCIAGVVVPDSTALSLPALEQNVVLPMIHVRPLPDTHLATFWLLVAVTGCYRLSLVLISALACF